MLHLIIMSCLNDKEKLMNTYYSVFKVTVNSEAKQNTQHLILGFKLKKSNLKLK